MDLIGTDWSLLFCTNTTMVVIREPVRLWKIHCQLLQQGITTVWLQQILSKSDVKRNENNCFVLAQLLNVSLVTYRDNLPKHPDREYFENLRKNVQALRDVGYRFIETPEVPPQPINTYQKVNDLEKILHDVYEVYNSNFTYYAGEGLCAGDDTNLLL